MHFALHIIMHSILKYGLSLGSIGLTVTVAYRLYTKISHKDICKLIFTNPSGNCCQEKPTTGCVNPYCIEKNSDKIIHHIDEAKSSICVAMLIFTFEPFMRALIRAHERGVTVRVLTCIGMEPQSRPILKELNGNGKTDLHQL